MKQNKDFNGVILSTAELAQKTKYTEKQIARRIKAGGIEYALSDCKTIKEFKRRSK